MICGTFPELQMGMPVNTFHNLEKIHLRTADILQNQSNCSAIFLKIWTTPEKKNREKCF